MRDEVTRAEALFLTAVVVLVAAAGWTLLRMPGSGHVDAAMLDVAPAGEVQLSQLEPELQQLYHGAAADQDGFHAVRCYCGCEAMLEHRSLLDCFVRPDGAWERHAAGCGVCQAEARQVVAARAAGTPLAQVVADIDAAYGRITGGQER